MVDIFDHQALITRQDDLLLTIRQLLVEHLNRNEVSSRVIISPLLKGTTTVHFSLLTSLFSTSLMVMDV